MGEEDGKSVKKTGMVVTRLYKTGELPKKANATRIKQIHINLQNG